MTTLSHVDTKGNINMVDVGDKVSTKRVARAEGFISMSPDCLAMIKQNNHKKGEVLTTAKIAGIMAAKRTSDLIPLCHPLSLSKSDITIEIDECRSCLRIESLCKLTGKTGVEMEALTAVSIACLTIFDMCKAVDPSMNIFDIRVIEKQGGKSGQWNSK